MTKFEFIQANIGKKVYVTGDGDLYFNGELRPIISSRHRQVELTIVKLTKGGKAYLVADDGLFYSVPIKNVKLIDEDFLALKHAPSVQDQIISVSERAIKTKWTVEYAKDISAYHNLDDNGLKKLLE